MERGEIAKHNHALVELAKNANLYRGDLESAFRAITEASAHAMNTLRTSIWFYTEDHSGIRCMDLYQMHAGSHFKGDLLAAANYPSYFKAMKECDVIDAHDAHSDPRTKEFLESYLEPLSISSMLDIPIRIAGRTIGVMCHEHVGPARKWTLEEQNFVTAVAGFVSNAIEAHERIRAENNLKAAEQRLRDIVEHSTNLFYMHTPDHVLTYVSPQSRKFLGCEPEEALANWTGFLTDNRVNKYGIEATEKAIATGLAQPPYELELKGPNNQRIWVEVREAPVVRDGKTVAIVGALSDITESKRREEEMLRAQKLESLGILAGGIAHDFNNILTAILGNISLALFRLQPEDALYKLLEEAERASMYARDLTNQLLTFAKGGAPLKKIARLEELIRDSVRFSLSGTNVKCKLSLPPDLWVVDIDVGQITQVINNLVINACQAMPEGGFISIEAENREVKPEDNLPLKESKYLKIRISDHGIGIPTEHLSKVFDPYFTTKQKGSGLGLAVTYSIIKRHEGHISVQSELGAGATFTLYLPALGNGSVRTATQHERHVSSGGKVLLMDDEEMVRKVAGAMLARAGYECRTCGDGQEAISLYKQAKNSNEPFDALILDLTIPGGMGGLEALRKILDFDPGARAVVSSGYSNDPVMAHFKEYGFADVIAKPYKVAELSAVLGKLVKPPIPAGARQ